MQSLANKARSCFIDASLSLDACGLVFCEESLLLLAGLLNVLVLSSIVLAILWVCLKLLLSTFVMFSFVSVWQCELFSITAGSAICFVFKTSKSGHSSSEGFPGSSMMASGHKWSYIFNYGQWPQVIVHPQWWPVATSDPCILNDGQRPQVIVHLWQILSVSLL